jgi:flagellum-specific ATP synthase
MIEDLRHALEHAPLQKTRGKVVHAVGTLIEAELPGATVGSMCAVGGDKLSEVIGFRGRRALLMPLGSTEGVVYGTEVRFLEESITVAVGDALIGRVVDGLGHPIDEKPPLGIRRRRPVTNAPPPPMQRSLIHEPLWTGIRALDGMIPLGKGQRVCFIAGAGVGKSTLLGMVARHVRADINVICLIGERGREVREFIEYNLGPEGMARSIVVVVTSDASPPLKVKGAFLATTIAEHFRDEGRDVLLMMDSLTRFALAQRQIGLSAGEPPGARGFPPSTFELLPRLLERVGTGSSDRGGSITGIYTVLVDGDDVVGDPVADAVRGIVDGHVILSRKLASHGHFPAIQVLGSLSRVADAIVPQRHIEAAAAVRRLMAIWEDSEELIRLGAYKRGTNADVDRAIAAMPEIRKFLQQTTTEPTDPSHTLAWMEQIAKG